MRVRPVDPRHLEEEDLAAAHRILTGVLAHEEPDRRRPSRAELRHAMRVSWPGTRSAYWLSSTLAGRPVGLGFLSLPAGANRHTAHVDIWVLPDARGLGAGRQLMRESVRMAYSTGRDVITTRTYDGGDAASFARRVGCTEVQVERRCALDLGDVDPAQWPAAPAEYRLQRVVGATPEDLLPLVSAVHGGMADTPRGSSPVRVELHDHERVRAFDAMLAARGVDQLRVLAVDRATDEPAGISYVLVPRRAPARAEQGDTVVLPGHRGRGLARALKIEMLRWLGAERPRVRELTTWVSTDNGPMHAVNRSLGYVDAASYTTWQVSVDDITGFLGMR